MIILGINSINHHDPSACILVDGNLIAFAEEERFTRNKHGVGDLPINATLFCLTKLRISLEDVDYIATPWLEEEGVVTNPPGNSPETTFNIFFVKNKDQYPKRLRETLLKIEPSIKLFPPLICVSHHLAHAASAYRCSGFSEANILVVDGEGDRVSTTLALGKQNNINLIEQYPAISSLGHFYACVTKYLGLGYMAEGKTMGLAAYGNETNLFEDIFSISDTSYQINIGKHDGNIWDPNESGFDTIDKLWMSKLEKMFGPSTISPRTYDPTTGIGRSRIQIDHRKQNIAASAQYILEQILMHLFKSLSKQTGYRNFTTAGGVALNCSANGKLALMEEVDNFFIQPMSNDSGAVIGAVLEAYARLGYASRWPLDSTSLGPSFEDTDISQILEKIQVKYTKYENISNIVAQLLTENKTVGWFQDKMEGGPRALGYRSILANPGKFEMRDHVNTLKGREMWRPLAPSLKEENVAQVFGYEFNSPFMIKAYNVCSDMSDHIPAVVHVDNSARPQTVSLKTNPIYWHMLDEFEKKSGVPCILNTSFNLSHEPIVCTPFDAIRTFFSSSLDALAIGSFLVVK